MSSLADFMIMIMILFYFIFFYLKVLGTIHTDSKESSVSRAA